MTSSVAPDRASISDTIVDVPLASPDTTTPQPVRREGSSQPQPRSAPDLAPRILYVASTRHSGGLEVASVRLAAQLMESQPHRQEILFACRPGQYIEAHCARHAIPTVPLTVRNSGDLSGVQRLVEIVQRERIDMIHVHSRRDYVTAALAVRRMRRSSASDAGRIPKLMLHLHLVRPLGSPVFLSGYIFAPLVDRVLAVSQSVRRYVLRCHPQLSPEQVVVVPNAVDTAKFRHDASSRVALRGEHKIADQSIVIGMVGRLDAKGQEYVLRALAEPEIRERAPHLMLVGDEGKPGTLRRLKQLASHLKLDDRVIFCGAQSSVAPFLSAMDILAHMPLDEAFGLAPAEAMAARLPVVASEIGGCAELIENNKTGLLANPLRRREIAAQLARLIGDQELRRRLGAAGELHVETNYNAQVQLGVLTGIYQELAHERAAS